MKILEAAAMRTPVVSTRIGAEGLEFADGKEILLADTPQEFADAAVELLENRHLRQKIGAAARLRVQVDYSLPALRGAIEQMHEALMTRSVPSADLGAQITVQ